MIVQVTKSTMRTILPCSPKDVANDAGLGSLSKMIGAVMHCISNSCRETVTRWWLVRLKLGNDREKRPVVEEQSRLSGCKAMKCSAAEIFCAELKRV